MTKNTAIICALLLAISGCKSLVYKGNKLYEAGMYRQAAEYYEQALAEDPEDLEAKQGLTLARDKLIDKGLIDVRMLRLANNHTAAANRLEEIVRNQAQWQVKPNGAIANTQREELDYARQWLQDEARILATTPYPDRFKLFEYNYRYLIDNAQLSSILSRYYETLLSRAKQQCNKLSDRVKGQRHFLKSFTEQYCLAWQTPKKLSVDSKDQSRYDSMYIKERVDLDLHYGNSIKGQYATFVSSLNRAFNQSLWFSPNGSQDLILELDIDADYYRAMNQFVQRKHYTLEVEKPDPSDPGKTHTVEETKEFAYPVTIYDEKFDLDISYKASLSRRYINGSASENKQNKTRSHQADFERLDIKPLQPNFLDLNSLSQNAFDKLTTKFIADLDATWEQHFCGHSLGTDQGENILRCARLNPENDFVNNWFTQNFGVTYAQMKTLYGI
ncbi:tetratricopeptide repeat protein [Pseudoalteromonas sp. T1lg65]|uniref:tetratricopeptide repeat protein n=1 Tax=Pseudoalteromonas sp. T1lg65 TaxID=2077101 RepID=UPI003F795717